MSFVKSGNVKFHSIRMNHHKRQHDINSMKNGLRGKFGNLISSEDQIANSTFTNINEPLILEHREGNQLEIVGRCSDYLNSQISIAPIYELGDGLYHLSGNYKSLFTETHSFIQENPLVGTQGTIRIVLHTLAPKIAVRFDNTGGTNNNVDISVYYK
jgi:hypothetical protein